MTAGEVMISFLLLVLVMLEIGRGAIGALDRVKVSRRFLGNNSPHGKEIRDI